jgi:PAS domain S-box-containing protein
MEKRNEIIIRYTVYGLLTGLFFPAASLLLHSLAGDISLTLRGFSLLHSMFPSQYLLDLIPLISAPAGALTGIMLVRQRARLYEQIRRERQRSEEILAFTEKLINNEFDAELHLEDDRDLLGRALINLRDNLKQNIQDQHARKKEDDQRNWVSEGLARFGDILRGSFSDMEEFSFNIISNLVKYLDANQGGFFLVEQEEGKERFFDMKACYAYDRKKFADKRIEWGEGLIGTCALEKQSIYMSDIPEGYLEITSGLGLANPDYLLIVPMLVQDEVLGIIELASFSPIEEFEIKLVESVAENTAITISSLRSNIRTADLLKESRMQAETLAEHEEKMRLSMEELKKTQEEAALQAEKFISFTNSVNHTLIRAEYDTDGKLVYANTRFLHKLGYYTNAEVEGQHISKFIDEKDMEWFNPIWERLIGGGKHYEGYMKHINKMGQDIWTMATYTSTRKEDGEIEKVLFLALDTTEQKKQSMDFEGQIEAINRLNLKAEFAPDGKFITCNDLFLETLKYTRKELENMSVFYFIEKKELESFNETWENVTRGIPFQGQVKILTKYEDEKWFRASYTAVNDMYGEVAKVIYLASDITNEKIMELESRKYTDQLKIHEDKLKLAGVEYKKKLEQARSEMEQNYKSINNERERFANILDSSPEIILTIDQHSKIVYLNKAGEKFWNTQTGQITGKDIKELFPGETEDYDSFIVSLFNPDSVKITGETKKVRIRNADGNWEPAEMLLSLSELADEVYYTVFISVI